MDRLDIHWRFKSFEQLEPQELYAILKARQEVFMIEQKIHYVDCDGKDQGGWHLFGYLPEQEDIVAYLRLLPPGKMKFHSVGRVLTRQNYRAQGLGKELMSEFLKVFAREFPGLPVMMSAQQYLEDFYHGFQFETSSQPYIEEGIQHVEMIRQALP